MTATDGSDPAPNVWRLVVVWWVLSVIGVLLMIFALGPHIPPGSATSQAHEQHRANVIIAAILTPIAIGLLVYFAYALTAFRQRGDVIEDGPPIHGNDRLPGRVRSLRYFRRELLPHCCHLHLLWLRVLENDSRTHPPNGQVGLSKAGFNGLHPLNPFNPKRPMQLRV